jgi:hypothetical protein
MTWKFPAMDVLSSCLHRQAAAQISCSLLNSSGTNSFYAAFCFCERSSRMCFSISFLYCGIFSFHPDFTRTMLTGYEVKKPTIIPICIMNQNTASFTRRCGPGNRTKNTSAPQTDIPI